MIASVGREHRNAYEKREGERRRQEMEHAERGEDDEVQHAYAAALQSERVARARRPQAPSDREQRDPPGRDRRKPQLDRHVHALVHVLEEEGDAEKQDDDAGLHEQVLCEQPLPEVGTARLRPEYRRGCPRFWLRLGLLLRQRFRLRLGTPPLFRNRLGLGRRRGRCGDRRRRGLDAAGQRKLQRPHALLERLEPGADVHHEPARRAAGNRAHESPR